MVGAMHRSILDKYRFTLDALFIGACLIGFVVLPTVFCGCSERITIQAVGDTHPGACVVILRAGKKVIVKLGEVSSTYSGLTTIQLRNTASSDVRIDRYHSTCECTEVRGLPLLVSANSSCDLAITTDLAREPGFVGQLGTCVELFCDNELVGEIEVLLNVTHPT